MFVLNIAKRKCANSKCMAHFKVKGRNHRFCGKCAKERHRRYFKTAKGVAVALQYAKSETGRAVRRRYEWIRFPKKIFRKFLKLLGLPKNYDPHNLILSSKISDEHLKKIAGNNGWPDFRDEALEEKGPKLDCISLTQWARAILEYRAGRTYRVAWRFTSTKRRIFKDVFEFYEWQIKRA